MTINLSVSSQPDLKPRITVFGVGGAGGNAVNNMIEKGLEGVEFVSANTDAQALQQSLAPTKIQLGVGVTEGLGAGAMASVGAAAAEESLEQIVEQISGSHMCFITAGMGGGTGTGAAPIIAQAARELGVLTVGVVTKPFAFEGKRRMAQAEDGIDSLQKVVDTIIIIPNQNLFRVANENTTFTEAFSLADDVLYQGVKGVTDLMVCPGKMNLDFADVRSVMDEMGKAMMGTGEAEGESRAVQAAERAIANPLLDEISLQGAKGVLINITGDSDITLFEFDEAANRIRKEVDDHANIVVGSTLDETMQGVLRVCVVATGIAYAHEYASFRDERVFDVASTDDQPVGEGTFLDLPDDRQSGDAVDMSPSPEAELNEPTAPVSANPVSHPSPFGADTASDQPSRPVQPSVPDYPTTPRRPPPAPFPVPREPYAAPSVMRPHVPAPFPAAKSAEKRAFGLNALINRMRGQPSEIPGAGHPQPDGQNFGPPHVSPNGLRGPGDEHAHDEIEIPAFMRRQAN